MRDHEDDDKKFTITLDEYSGSANYTSTTSSYTITNDDYVYDTSSLGTIDVSSITFDDNWTSNYNGKYIDFDVLDKYPTAKTLYNQFISVYNMCEEEEKLNGD